MGRLGTKRASRGQVGKRQHHLLPRRRLHRGARGVGVSMSGHFRRHLNLPPSLS